MKKAAIITFSLIGLIAVAVFLFGRGFYPVAVVEGGVISKKHLDLSYGAGVRYYENALSTYGEPREDFDSEGFLTELWRASLDSLIEEEIIAQGLVEYLGKTSARQLVGEEVSGVDMDEISYEVERIYGLSIVDFTYLVLEPAAQREILDKILSESDISINAWLADRRLSVGVNVLISGLRWEDGAVVSDK